MIQRHAVLKACESERDLHNLHAFQHRLGWLYTWPQQAKEREKSKNVRRKRATVAPYLAASRPNSHMPAPLPPLHHRWSGGKAGEATTTGGLPRSH
ncbi:MAG TPA: hypothetical protein VKB35_08225 [Ktedonobacteraceae bacterium]|nr:hypothetical protein [Ktedonobacteraceae bacterium]